jgi:phage terminase large subunit-like protein
LASESPLSWIASLPAEERQAFLARTIQSKDDDDNILHQWMTLVARYEQRPPTDADWLVWLLLAGRGFGKTRSGAEAVRAEILSGRVHRVALVAPTAADVRDVMVEGHSGLLAISKDQARPVYEPSKRRILWPEQGAVAFCYSADEPERLRGPQHDLAWADELASWRYPDYAWDMLMMGLRLGPRPRAIVTTTPKPLRLIRQLARAATTRVTSGSTHDNGDNLPESFLTAILGKYEGTRLGRQEIYAELLEQADGALWTRAMVESARITPLDRPEMTRIVVAVDPAVTATEQSDETGIIVAGLGVDGRAYVMEDASGRFSADQWARRAVNLYERCNADRIVAEVNNGGDLVALTIRTVSDRAAFKAVSASKGKRIRAEPVSALYEQGRVKHVGGFPILEDQMCNWVPTGADHSPDRLDALVWAITELALADRTTGLIDWYKKQSSE